jgi:hypothetical protein
MDADNRNMSEKDPIARLLQEVGRQQAPIDMEQRVLALVSEQKTLAISTEQLFRGWHWAAAGTLFIILAVSGMLWSSSSQDTDPADWIAMNRYWAPFIRELITTPWALMTCMVTFCLLLLDRALSRRTEQVVLG